MFRFVLLACVIPAMTMALDFSACGARPTPTSVTVSGCDAQPCDIMNGADITVSIDFVAGTDSNYLNPNVISIVGEEYFPYEIPEEFHNGCNSLVVGSCPISTGGSYSYSLTVPISTTQPAGTSGVIRVALYDADENTFACFESAINLVG